MPFSDTFDFIYGEIKQNLSKHDYLCSRADELFGSVPIMSNVLKSILQSHFVIADLTGQNANVFYELGVAHSFKDAHNIILIAQKVDDVPFDIRHLRTIIYNESNIKYLTANILKAIAENSHYYTFFEALQKKAIISSIHDDKYDYLETLQDSLGDKLSIVTDLLNGHTDPYDENAVREILDSCLGVLYTASASGDRKQLRGLMNVLGVLICQCGNYLYAHEMTNHLLYEIKLENYSIEKNEILHLQTELAISLATNKIFFNDVMSWIIGYFKRSKSATVDLNRYNLERFLLTSDDIDIDSVIVNSMFHENYYVREHMADMIGEKGILSGVDALTTQLEKEENIYTTSSIITALGKLGNKKGYASIVKWFNNHEEKIIRTQHYFILKHIHISILKLGIRDEFVEKFEKKYAEHLTPLAIF
jgi:hypothetical protein